MKEKKLTITSKNISQKQWSNLILELNLITKAWAPYATISLHAPGIKKVKADDGTYVFVGKSKLHGTVRHTKTKTNRLRR
jgi:hypothetical protein